MPQRPREIEASIEIPEVLHRLHLRYGEWGPGDYLAGKTEIRDTVMEHLLCSSLEAEEIVDLLEVEGYLEFFPDRASPEPGNGVWRLHRVPPEESTTRPREG